MVDIKLIVDGATVYDNVVTDPEPDTEPQPNPDPVQVPLGESYFKPANETELRQCIQDALDFGYVAYLDPKTEVEVQNPLLFNVKDNGGAPKGVNGNYAKIRSVINDGRDVLTFKSTQNNRCIVVEKLSVYGGGYEGRISGAGIKVTADKGKAIYKGTFRDLYTDYCGKSGIHFEGDVFESLLDNLNSENNGEHGVYMAHMNGGIISNMMTRAPNLSRNWGYGLYLKDCGSVDVYLGSFIMNKLGGIYAGNGIRSVDGVNFENSGEIGIDVPTSAYLTRITNCEASTDGKTTGHGGQPMKWTFRYKGPEQNLFAQNNHITPYLLSAPFTGGVRAP